MKLMLCTLILNEIEWLDRLHEQHKDWPGVELHWCFVEGADAVFAATNPDRVSPAGLSVDGTSEALDGIAGRDHGVTVIHHGLMRHPDPAQSKCVGRQRYLDVAEKVRPDFLLVVDGDEMYARADQEGVVEAFARRSDRTGYCFRQRHIWRPPSVAGQDLFADEVAGGFWAIPHVRGWRWRPGLRYASNHNTPELPNGQRLDVLLKRFEQPQCVHLGFAAGRESRRAKHAYYQARGEGRTDHRAWYVQSRAAWESWRPGVELPRGAKVVPYQGPIPEVFRDA